MYLKKRLRISLWTCALTLLWVGSSAAQQIRFPDFNNPAADLQFNGVAKLAKYQNKVVLRVTDGASEQSPEASSTYFKLKQPVSNGFSTFFSFQMHAPETSSGPGDGIAFILQDAPSVDTTMGASGAGLTALGAGMDISGKGGLGYAGIKNSLAIELDVSQDAWDPTPNHVAVQSCGANTNTPVHLPGDYTIGQNTHVTSCLVNGSLTSKINSLADGNIHNVVIDYEPPTAKKPGLYVWVDPTFIQGTHTAKSAPDLSIPSYVIDDANGLVLDKGTAWVGFTGSQSNKAIAQDILEWEFTPHQATQVQELIQNDGTANIFTFGGHVAKVTYPQGTQVDGKYMTVLATPTDPHTFYNTRLKGTQFQNELCITYLETGGNCMVYSVTCQESDKVTQTTCPSLALDQILLNTSYYTADPVTNNNADFLKADPIGTNNWITICNPPHTIPPCYDPNVFDGTTSGKGHDLSDLVATFMTMPHPNGAGLVAEPPRPVATEPKRTGLQ